MLAVGVLLLTTLGSCGFNDTLTSRGFIKEGDQICIDTLVKARVRLHSRANVTGPEFLATLGAAYGAAAVQFRRLDIRSQDEPMRDRVASGYSSFSQRLRAASRAPLGSGVGATEARTVFVDASALQRSMKAYGFQACGGGGAPA